MERALSSVLCFLLVGSVFAGNSTTPNWMREHLRTAITTDQQAYSSENPIRITVTTVNTTGDKLSFSGIGSHAWEASIVADDETVADSFSSIHVPWGQWSTSFEPHGTRAIKSYVWYQKYGLESDGVYGEPVPAGWYRVRLRPMPIFNQPSDSFIESAPFYICEEDHCNEPEGKVVSYIPAVANSPGAHGTFWQTDLVFVPTKSWSFHDIEAKFSFLAKGRDNSDPLTATVNFGIDHGPAVRLNNIVQQLFGVRGTGALRIEFSKPGLKVTSFTTTVGLDGGRYGVTIPAFDPLDALPKNTVVFFPLSAFAFGQGEGTSRTNIGFVELGGSHATVTVSPVRGESFDVNLKPFEYKQINDPFSGDSSSYVLLTADSAIVAYAAIVDNTTGDVRFVLASPYNGELAVPWVKESAGVE